MHSAVIFFRLTADGKTINQSATFDTVARIRDKDDAAVHVARVYGVTPDAVEVVEVGHTKRRGRRYAQHDPLLRPRGAR